MANSLPSAVLAMLFVGCSTGSVSGGSACGAAADCLRGQACVSGRCVMSDARIFDTRDARVDRGMGDAGGDATSEDSAPDSASDGRPDVPADAPPLDEGVDAPPDEGLDLLVERDVAPPAPDVASPEPDMAPPEPDMAPPVPDMAPPRLRIYGEPCLEAAQCASGVCVADPENGGGVCSSGCDGNDGCPGLDVCHLAENGGGVCFRPQTGRVCVDGGDCLSGVCVTPPDPVAWLSIQPTCGDRCDADRHCPAGFRCGNVEAPNGFVRVCITAVRQINTCLDGRRIDCLGSCVVPQGRDPQDIPLCLDINNAVGPGYCSCTCRNAVDCPAGYACQLAPDLSGDPTRPGVCLAMAGYRCPFEARNPNILQCPSLACLGEEDPDQSYCTALCRDDLDCPGDYTCEDVGDGLQACTPVQ